MGYHRRTIQTGHPDFQAFRMPCGCGRGYLVDLYHLGEPLSRKHIAEPCLMAAWFVVKAQITELEAGE